MLSSMQISATGVYSADRNPELVLKELAAFGLLASGIAVNVHKAAPSKEGLCARVHAILTTALADAEAAIKNALANQHADLVMPNADTIQVDRPAVKAFLTGRVYIALVSILDALHNHDSANLFGFGKQPIRDFFANAGDVDLSAIKAAVAQVTIGNSTRVNLGGALVNALAALTDDRTVAAWFTHAVTYAATRVLADLDMDHALPSLRCQFLPALLGLSCHWNAIQHLGAGLKFGFPPLGTLYDPNFMAEFPDLIGTLPIDGPTVRHFVLFPITPTLRGMPVDGKVSPTCSRGSNYYIPVQVISPDSDFDALPTPKVVEDNDVDSIMIRFKEHLEAVAAAVAADVVVDAPASPLHSIAIVDNDTPNAATAMGNNTVTSAAMTAGGSEITGAVTPASDKKATDLAIPTPDFVNALDRKQVVALIKSKVAVLHEYIQGEVADKVASNAKLIEQCHKDLATKLAVARGELTAHDGLSVGVHNSAYYNITLCPDTAAAQHAQHLALAELVSQCLLAVHDMGTTPLFDEDPVDFVGHALDEETIVDAAQTVFAYFATKGTTFTMSIKPVMRKMICLVIDVMATAKRHGLTADPDMFLRPPSNQSASSNHEMSSSTIPSKPVDHRLSRLFAFKVMGYQLHSTTPDVMLSDAKGTPITTIPGKYAVLQVLKGSYRVPFWFIGYDYVFKDMKVVAEGHGYEWRPLAQATNKFLHELAHARLSNKAFLECRQLFFAVYYALAATWWDWPIEELWNLVAGTNKCPANVLDMALDSCGGNKLLAMYQIALALELMAAGSTLDVPVPSIRSVVATGFTYVLGAHPVPNLQQ
ncbi:hypothetical protein BC828DRAFT_239689 [Blastocladiella britannica]|nr:hypothetical protein BC828DRAFT_239689 [Blastocladiella britannica]